MATRPQVVPEGQGQPTQQQDPGLAALQKQLKEQEAEVTKLKQQVSKGPAVVPPAQQPQQQPPTKEAIEQMFWKDPLPYVDAIARRAAWETEQRIQQQGGDTARALARKEARSADPEVFDKYEVEIEAMVAGVAPQFQGNINVWQNALNMVRGQHIDDILEEKRKKAQPPADGAQPPRAGQDGPAPPSSKAPPAPKEKPLNDEEKEVARGLHLSDEEYRRGKQRYDNQAKEWAKVVTFSSEDKRRAAAAAKREAAKGGK